jgi:GNAT superfamily N-acetyltransferase
MVWDTTLLIEPISRTHNRKVFDSGDEEVTRFLRERALQDHERNLSRTMVLVAGESDPVRIMGYHTLLMAQVKQEEIPQDEKPLIKRPITVILLGQLGVDKEFQSRGLGEFLLMDAQARVDEISRKAGVRAMMLDARTERLATWYEEHDFIRFPGKFRMFKRIEEIRKLNLINQIVFCVATLATAILHPSFFFARCTVSACHFSTLAFPGWSSQHVSTALAKEEFLDHFSPLDRIT